MHFILSLLLLLTPSFAPEASAGDAPAIQTPEKGTALRTELLDAARPVFEQELGAPVEFVVRTLNVMDGWAYGAVRPQRPGGKAIDWHRTKLAEAFAEGMLETDLSMILLKETGQGWQLVEYAIGPTDVAWDWWRQQHGLPYELFGASAQDFADPR